MVQNNFTTFLVLHVWIHLSCLKIADRNMQTCPNYEDGQPDFTEELIKQLAGLCVDADVPLACNNSVTYLIILLMNKGTKKSFTKRNKKSRKYKCQMSGPWDQKNRKCLPSFYEYWNYMPCFHVWLCVLCSVFNIIKYICDSRECERCQCLSIRFITAFVGDVFE